MINRKCEVMSKMKNPFKDKTDEELKMLYKQYKEFQKTGILPDNELGKIRDELSEKVNTWHVLMMQYLLETIGDRWSEKI